MKIICDCGNEVAFSTIDQDTGKETSITEGEGQYATIDMSNFRFWQMHDVVGAVCEKCDKSIWMFT